MTEIRFPRKPFEANRPEEVLQTYTAEDLVDPKYRDEARAVLALHTFDVAYDLLRLHLQ